MTFLEQLQEDQALIERVLSTAFLKEDEEKTYSSSLISAMRYSLLAGGKRIRPVLVLEVCRACGGEVEKAIDFACAIEMVHTYSLIHDDLPCMDNDDYRRGRLTNHKVYGEAMAVLAGDALLTAAFELLTSGAVTALFRPDQIIKAVYLLANGAGKLGMLDGQVLDLAYEGRTDLTLNDLRLMDDLKTGELIRCACALGVIAADGDDWAHDAMGDYAWNIGLAFQIRDDILDVTGDQSKLGKPIGSDAVNGKVTYVSLCGLEKSQQMVEQLTEEAKSAAARLPQPAFLQWLADYLAGRSF